MWAAVRYLLHSFQIGSKGLNSRTSLKVIKLVFPQYESMHTKYVKIEQSYQKLYQFTYFAFSGGGFDRPHLIFLSDCFPSDEICSLDQYLQNDSKNEIFARIRNDWRKIHSHVPPLLGH